MIKDLNNLLKLGDKYSKKDLSVIIDEPSLITVREGIYTSKNFNSILLFVDLIKKGKEARFHFNDYFQEDYFHWDSQTTQHLNSPRIQTIILKSIVVNLFVRIDPKIKGVTQPFSYCGRLDFLEYNPNTSKPIHIIFQSLDYDENCNSLIDIYNWRPESSGRTSSNDLLPLPKKKRGTYTKPNYTERRGLVTSRVGQGFYRQEVLSKWDNKCAVTGVDLKEVLIASHIVPWSKSNENERLDPNNSILLSPNLDALFDKHLISFDENGSIVISEILTAPFCLLYGINKEMKLRVLSTEMKAYLIRHLAELK